MIGDNTFVLLLLLSPAFACDTTTLTATRDPTNVTTISINSEVGLTVTVVEAEAFVATVSFYGRDNVNTLFRIFTTRTLGPGASRLGLLLPPILHLRLQTHRYFFLLPLGMRCSASLRPFSSAPWPWLNVQNLLSWNLLFLLDGRLPAKPHRLSLSDTLVLIAMPIKWLLLFLPKPCLLGLLRMKLHSFRT